MRIALCSDEPYPVHTLVRELLQARGHEVIAFGSVASGKDEPWADVAEQAALAVAHGDCDEGVFFCWSGTGISMAANKVAGIRAALCSDPGAAKAARIWNHANVLCLSNRTLSTDMAKEMIAAWFDHKVDHKVDAKLDSTLGTEGEDGVRRLQEVDARHRK